MKRARGQIRDVALAVAWRSIHNYFTNPALLIPSLLFPLFFFSAFAGGLSAIGKVPNFDFRAGYTAFQFVFVLLQSSAFGGVFTGFGIALDFETGIARRLMLAAPRRAGIVLGYLLAALFRTLLVWALLAGLLAGVVALSLVQAATYLTVALAAGASVAAGLPGVLVIVALTVAITLGFGAIGLFAALRTGSGEAVQGLFPVLFVMLFLSSGNLPRDLIQTDWFREVATYNPVSYLIEAIRSLLIDGWDAQALELGFGIAVAIIVVAMVAANAALRSRLVRT